MKKRIVALLLALAMLVSLAACGGTNKGLSPGKDLKVGFIYIGPVGDGGWTDAHDAGRKEALAKYPNVESIIIENVPETAECEQAIRNLIDQGCTAIFATSFGHQDSMVNVAKDFPNIKFFHATGYKTAANLSQYNGRMYQARFLAGLAAGKKTKNGKVGYVGAMGIPEVVRGINAYALGVKVANPKATVKVIWTKSWVDPSAARACADELLNSGCDVIGYHQDFTSPIVAAQAKGAFATGNNVSSVGVADGAYLTAPLFSWGSYYSKTFGELLGGTYVGGQSYWGSYADGIVKLDPLTSICAEGTQALVDEYAQKLMDGSWDVFTGEIKDQAGKVRVKAGEKMTDEQLLDFNWFVQNVIGTIE